MGKPKLRKEDTADTDCVTQEFKNSPTLFGNQLAKDLEQWERPHGAGTILQYVHDLLIATEMKELCIIWTISLLNFLGLNGYRVSPQKD